MSEMNGRLAYVVGERYSNLAQLPGVITASQFFKEMLAGTLPMNLTWMMGQGLNSMEDNLLRLCKTYRPEICFYGDEKIKAAQDFQQTFFSKLSQFMKNMAHRLGFLQ